MVGQTPWWLVLGEQVLSLGRTCGQPSVSGQVNMQTFQVLRQKQKRDGSFLLNRQPQDAKHFCSVPCFSTKPPHL